MEPTKGELILAGLPIATQSERLHRLSMLIWGSSGCGKTTIAATTPGRKLWLNFDTDGTAALTGKDDILIADFSTEPNSVVQKFKEENPIRIEKFIVDNKIDTVVFDSLTSFGEKALHHGVKIAQGTPKGRTSTLEDPGYAGFGNKNTWTRLVVRNLLQSTAKTNTHCVFIAHEDKPTTDEHGSVLFISIMLGSSLNEQVPLQISEVWHMSDTGRKRMIAIRSCRGYKPMRTRMFRTTMGPEFEWKYNAETQEGETIEDWYNLWVKQGDKIPLPGTKEYSECLQRSA